MVIAKARNLLQALVLSGAFIVLRSDCIGEQLVVVPVGQFWRNSVEVEKSISQARISVNDGQFTNMPALFLLVWTDTGEIMVGCTCTYPSILLSLRWQVTQNVRTCCTPWSVEESFVSLAG